MQQPVTTCLVDKKNPANTTINDLLQHLTDRLAQLKSTSKLKLENIVSANNPVLQYFNSTNQTNNEVEVTAILHNLLLINKFVLQKNVKVAQPHADFSNTLIALSKLAYALIKAAESSAQLQEGREATTAGRMLILSLQIAKIVELAIVKAAAPKAKQILQRNLYDTVLIQNNAQWNLGIAFATAAESDKHTDVARAESYKFALQHLESGLRTTLLKNSNDLNKIDSKWPNYLLQVCRYACVLTKDKAHCSADHLFFLREEQRLTKEFGKTDSLKKTKTEHNSSVNSTKAVIPKQAFFQAPTLSAPDKVPLTIRYSADSLPLKKRLYTAFTQD